MADYFIWNLKSVHTSFKTLLFISWSLLTASSHGASVWKVSSESEHIYIGGTIHVLAEQDYPLPKEYDLAYSQSSSLVFETDMQAVMTAEFGQKLVQQMSLPPGQTLKSLIEPDIYQQLVEHCASRGIPLDNFQPFQPSFLAINLSMIELQRIGLTSHGVDVFYANKGRQDNKPQLWLESPDEQIAFLRDMGKSDENAVIAHTLKDIKKMPSMINTLRAAWRDGDMQALEEIGIKAFSQDYPKVYESLIVTRNKQWMPKILDMLNTPDKEFVLVGALHLAGKDSVLTQLEAQGLKVEKVTIK